jgi:hypothetical protein
LVAGKFDISGMPPTVSFVAKVGLVELTEGFAIGSSNP